MKLGIDIGSVTAKAVVLDEADNIIESRYTRTRGQPVETILSILEDLLAKYPPGRFEVAAATGTGGGLIADLQLPRARLESIEMDLGVYNQSREQDGLDGD